MVVNRSTIDDAVYGPKFVTDDAATREYLNAESWVTMWDIGRILTTLGGAFSSFSVRALSGLVDLTLSLRSKSPGKESAKTLTSAIVGAAAKKIGAPHSVAQAIGVASTKVIYTD